MNEQLHLPFEDYARQMEFFFLHSEMDFVQERPAIDDLGEGAFRIFQVDLEKYIESLT